MIIIIIIDIQFPTIGWVFSHKYNPTTSTTSCSHDRNPQDHLDFCCHWFRWNANITSGKTWWVHYDSTTMSLCLGLFFPGLCNTAEKPDIVKWRCGRWRRWTLVNMEMMLQIYFERLGSSNQGDANQKNVCVCVYAVLCADSSVVDPEVVKSLTPEKHVQCIQIKEKHGETRTFWREKPCRHPSMSTMQSVTIPHWLNTKEDGYHFMHLELQGSAQPSVWWGKSDGMPQLSTIPINAIKNSLNPKINPKTKLKNPNHPTIPMPKPFLVRLSAANGKASARCWHDLDGNELLPLWLRGKTHQ